MIEQVDLVIRNGTVVDGTGAPPFRADIGISEGRFVSIGHAGPAGRREIDAAGSIVTPGFVDIHTHYDGHATWGARMRPSSNHGVTTVVMGNCGVGFAPCRARDRTALVRLMEGVEDIPGAVMSSGLPWTWESFPDYLDTLAQRRFDVDVAAYLPHAPLRVFAMGQRGLDREPATARDIDVMAELAGEALRAGAIGFSTTRTLNHRASDGSLTPAYGAAERELLGIALALRAAGAGVLQVISDFDDPEAEFDMIERVVRRCERPASISLMQVPHAPARWRILLARIEKANRDGLAIRAQVAPRPIGSLMGLELSLNPFTYCPSYREIAALPFAERLDLLGDAVLRRRILEEFPTFTEENMSRSVAQLSSTFEMAEFPDYEPEPTESLSAIAASRGMDAPEYAYDRLIAKGGKTIFYRPMTNYVDGTIEAVETMLSHPHAVLGLGDGGAHSGIICDASFPTYMLDRWGSGRRSSPFSLPQAVKALTKVPAELVGLHDRGQIRPGYKADLNVIDLDRIRLSVPEVVYDLPDNGPRLNQRADGYRATIVSGQVTYGEGQEASELPGRLVRANSIDPPASG